jgi:hypothetical protein
VLGFALLAAGLFAAGAQEDSLAQYRDKVNLTGTLQFTDGYPELNVAGKAYAIVAPGVMREARTLKPGLRMTVEGYKLNSNPRMARPNVDHVVAEKITIDGKSFDLGTAGRGGRMSGGTARGGMMGGRRGDNDDRGPMGRWDNDNRPGSGPRRR